MESRQCANCDCLMEYNKEEARWECKGCGCTETTILNTTIPPYVG